MSFRKIFSENSCRCFC
ncbi:hypothetical protein EJ377_18685 [Chryseobacterium arthrosphaerae]|uniref:Uncharacterized protein n=1 Tax=Chryseobacterium arthrosphaerae TaxID=651561 RepID=A0A432DUU6_9FLAO|nr:hypothetical protein EJ377_18685 [Chryseobacterium arthrosphaerae]